MLSYKKLYIKYIKYMYAEIKQKNLIIYNKNICLFRKKKTGKN